MLLCVILLWPSKIKNSLILMQNVFNIWDLRTIWLKILFLKDLGYVQVFFEKPLISYSCILFMKYHALRSLCISLLCFSKIWFFHIFNRSNLLLDRLKLRLKFCFESTWLNRFSINARSIECNFRSIKSVFQSIENCSKSFLKHEIFTCSSLFKTFQKALSLSLWPIQIQSQFFCRFPSNFLQGFCLLAPVRPFYPFFFGLISFFMHLKGKFRTYGILGFLVFSMISFKIDQWVFIVGWY